MSLIAIGWIVLLLTAHARDRWHDQRQARMLRQSGRLLDRG